MAFISQVSEFLPEGNLEALTRLSPCDWFPYQPYPYNLETVLMETNTYRTHWTFLLGREKIQCTSSKQNVLVGLLLMQVYMVMMCGNNDKVSWWTLARDFRLQWPLLWGTRLSGMIDVCIIDLIKQNFLSVSYMHATSITWTLLVMQLDITHTGTYFSLQE